MTTLRLFSISLLSVLRSFRPSRPPQFRYIFRDISATQNYISGAFAPMRSPRCGSASNQVNDRPTCLVLMWYRHDKALGLVISDRFGRAVVDADTYALVSALSDGTVAEWSKALHSSVHLPCVGLLLQSRKRRGFESHRCQHLFCPPMTAGSMGFVFCPSARPIDIMISAGRRVLRISATILLLSTTRGSVGYWPSGFALHTARF